MTFDPPNPLNVVRGIFAAALAIATVVLVISFVSSGHVEWRIVALVGLLWTFLGVFTDLLALIARPFQAVFDMIVGGGSTLGPDDEMVMLQQQLARGLPADHEVLATIRLAELYREHRYDKPTADALLDRLLLKYPDSRELQVARRLPR